MDNQREFFTNSGIAKDIAEQAAKAFTKHLAQDCSPITPDYDPRVIGFMYLNTTGTIKYVAKDSDIKLRKLIPAILSGIISLITGTPLFSLFSVSSLIDFLFNAWDKSAKSISKIQMEILSITKTTNGITKDELLKNLSEHLNMHITTQQLDEEIKSLEDVKLKDGTSTDFIYEKNGKIYPRDI